MFNKILLGTRKKKKSLNFQLGRFETELGRKENPKGTEIKLNLKDLED